ncbi:glutamate-5-semialdehyde dehydrogenase [Alkalicoccus urumqiensis]|uniref:Gamma-glutamyl phosphate reductase n=1 Tax=Alkalicoccus urumqiensis TaxID=1548213 RepID=A0A2P6MKY6_ALKUR|nr:glutamate-5-semialdehyde dehydrogenase [Alkalicoccus urumqiensis]PRO66940.1 glutamate-5-semialdehyde dehydrogenase [Alkalicoccus urumqiensis]
MSEVLEKGKKAKLAARRLTSYSEADRQEALHAIAAALLDEKQRILEANEADVSAAVESGMPESLIDRLKLTEERLLHIAEACKAVASLPNPLSSDPRSWERPNGLVISEWKVPLGVVGVIYEARPNVTVDISALALKTGNAVLLRGSSSTIHSNKQIVDVIRKAAAGAGYPEDAVQLIENTDRSLTNELFQARGLVDVLIPRGSKKLIDTVVEKSLVPVIETGAGNCHMYIDAQADVRLARTLAVDAKVQRPSVCNAIENLVIHREWAMSHLSSVINDMELHGVTVTGCETACRMDARIQPASPEDFEQEFNDLKITVKIAEDIYEALDHISTYTTNHSEAIITPDQAHADLFFERIDAAALYHNASTRFTDGEEFGYGAEVGISTQKLHARGPMGLDALTTWKYILQGNGQQKGSLPLSEEK